MLQPGKFTELFFLDEATAFAAGHRPCALCRNADYKRLVELWRDLHPRQEGADAIDAQLHLERVDPHTRRQRHHDAFLDELPDGAFVLMNDDAWVVRADELLRWSAAGYDTHAPRPPGVRARLITPPSLLAVLRARPQSLVPLLHPSAE